MSRRRPGLAPAAWLTGLAGLALLAYGVWRHAPWGDALGRDAPGPRVARGADGRSEGAPRRRGDRRERRTSGRDEARGAALVNAAATGRLARRELVESSGAAMSVAQPGVLFTVNDAGNEPTLFATDVTGADRGAWRVSGATNVDWEAVALGPCPAGGAPRCVYIGDTGDNDARYRTRAIYRVSEPAATARAGTLGATAAAERLTYVYADGPQDVEAMYAAPDGAVYLVTKRRRADRAGALRPALVYRLPASAWTRPTSERDPAVAELADSLPAIVPGSASLRVVTDAALAPDARRLAVRTYWQLFVFETDARTGRVRHDVAPSVCDLSPLREEQGEAVTWLGGAGRGDADAVVLTSEGAAAPVHVVTCPARERAGTP